MTIKETQALVDQWIKEYGVRYFDELTNMAILTEEVGEVARIISRTVSYTHLRDHETRGNLVFRLLLEQTS